MWALDANASVVNIGRSGRWNISRSGRQSGAILPADQPITGAVTALSAPARRRSPPRRLPAVQEKVALACEKRTAQRTSAICGVHPYQARLEIEMGRDC